MDAERWRAACALFEQAVELAPPERERFVDASCAGDLELATEVRTLLEADGASTPLDANAAELHASAEDAEQRALIGARVAGWTLVELVGRGGTASVFRATRADGATAAVKVLRPSFASSELVGRFRAERRVLAGLDHPGIPSVIDAGELDDGRPFLITAFVDGQRIDRHCEARELPTRARLELFVEVCEAVHHAHVRLVVHRDLKPSNVLVDAAGRPQVLDFGIAKILDADATGTDWTRTGAGAPMTPAYASPEQLRGESATTASDVYSLGVMLRELTVGPRARDLETIVGCALRESPEERYASARHLADDLRRHLAGEPIAARRPSFATRLRVLARRHPGPSAMLGAGVLALIAALIFARASLERVRAGERVAWRAHADAAYATNALADVLVDVAERRAIEPDSVRALLAELEARIAAELETSPEAEGRLRMALARAHVALGSLEPADEHARRALELVRTTRGFGPAELRGALALACDVAMARDDPRALALATELLALCEEQLGPEHERTAAARERLERANARYRDRTDSAGLPVSPPRVR